MKNQFSGFHLLPPQTNCAKIFPIHRDLAQTYSSIFTDFKRIIKCFILTKNIHSDTGQSPTLRQNQLLNICRAKRKRAEKASETQLAELSRSRARLRLRASGPLPPRPRAFTSAHSPAAARVPGAPLVAPPLRSWPRPGPARGPAPPPTSVVMSRLLPRQPRISAPEATAAASRGGGGVGRGGRDSLAPPIRAGRALRGREAAGEPSRAYFAFSLRDGRPARPISLCGDSDAPSRAGPGRGLRRRPPAGATLEPPPPCPPRFSRSLGGRRGLGPGRQARCCGGRSSPRWAPGLARRSAAPS